MGKLIVITAGYKMEMIEMEPVGTIWNNNDVLY